MKYATDRPFADPEAAARKLLEIANATEAVQDGRIHIEKLNGPFLFKEGGSPAEYGAGIAVGANFLIKPRRTGYLVAGTRRPRPELTAWRRREQVAGQDCGRSGNAAGTLQGRDAHGARFPPWRPVFL
jgi:hypothetical protein